MHAWLILSLMSTILSNLVILSSFKDFTQNESLSYKQCRGLQVSVKSVRNRNTIDKLITVRAQIHCDRRKDVFFTTLLCDLCHLIHLSIHWSMGSAPVGVQCPITSSLGEFLGYWAGSCILGYCPCWCRPTSYFPSLSISRCFFHSLFFTCHWISFVFFINGQRICNHSCDPLLIHVLGEFPGLGMVQSGIRCCGLIVLYCIQVFI